MNGVGNKRVEECDTVQECDANEATCIFNCMVHNCFYFFDKQEHRKHSC